MEISLEIKKARKARGYTLDALARLCGLSKGYLSKIERGVKVPSFATFQAIAEALGVDAGELLRVGRANPTRRNIEVLKNPGEQTTPGDGRSVYSFSALLSDYRNKQISPFLFYIRTGTTDAMSHDSEEFVYVLSGKVELHYEKEVYELSQGDCFYLDSRLKHFFVNRGEETARLLAVNYNYRRF